MRAVFVKGALALSICVHSGQHAAADDLVMPYACSLTGGAVTLSPSAPATYGILGARDERIHEACGLDDAGRQVCTHLSVHRFDIACAGGTASWAKVANAARVLGIDLPSGLPPGYAPTAALQARIVLPAQARFSSNASAGVTREALSADSVLMPDELADAGGAGVWSTVIKAEMRPEVPGRAMQVGLAATGVLGALLLMAYAFTRQAREMPPAFPGLRFPPHVVEAVLNHRSGTRRGVAAVYNRHDHLDEKREALAAWAQRVNEIVTGKSANVVKLPARGRK